MIAVIVCAYYFSICPLHFYVKPVPVAMRLYSIEVATHSQVFCIFVGLQRALDVSKYL